MSLRQLQRDCQRMWLVTGKPLGALSPIFPHTKPSRTTKCFTLPQLMCAAQSSLFFSPFRPTNCWKLQVQTCSSSCTSPEGMLQGILGTWQDQERVVRDGVGELCHVCFLWSRSKDVSAAVTVKQHHYYHFSRRWCQIRSNVDKKLWINRQTKSFEAVQLTCITAARDIAAESSSRNRRFWHNIWLVLRVMDSLP